MRERGWKRSRGTVPLLRGDGGIGMELPTDGRIFLLPHPLLWEWFCLLGVGVGGGKNFAGSCRSSDWLLTPQKTESGKPPITRGFPPALDRDKTCTSQQHSSSCWKFYLLGLMTPFDHIHFKHLIQSGVNLLFTLPALKNLIFCFVKYSLKEDMSVLSFGLDSLPRGQTNSSHVRLWGNFSKHIQDTSWSDIPEVKIQGQNQK